MRRIGNVSVSANSIILAVDKEAYGQGYIFKDENAFYYQPYEPCYVAEHQDVGDVAWCFHSFLELTGGRKALAAYLFESVDWQSPSAQPPMGSGYCNGPSFEIWIALVDINNKEFDNIIKSNKIFIFIYNIYKNIKIY